MPSLRPAPKTSANPITGSGNYVKLSDKLTDSIEDITKMINQHKSTIDSIQDIGIQLTATIGTLHTLTVKYAKMANNVLDILLPLLKNFPITPPKLLELATLMEKVTQDIIDNSVTTSKTINDVNSGLKTGNVDKLQSHSGELQKITSALTSTLQKLN